MGQEQFVLVMAEVVTQWGFLVSTEHAASVEGAVDLVEARRWVTSEGVELVGHKEHRPTYHVVNSPMGKDEADRLCRVLINARRISPESSALPQLLAAAEDLANHAEESYPHFESDRGKRDIAAARKAIQKIKLRM